jgi:hypothetical protein
MTIEDAITVALVLGPLACLALTVLYLTADRDLPRPPPRVVDLTGKVRRFGERERR